MKQQKESGWVFPIVAIVTALAIAGGVFAVTRPQRPTLVQAQAQSSLGSPSNTLSNSLE